MVFDRRSTGGSTLFQGKFGEGSWRIQKSYHRRGLRGFRFVGFSLWTLIQLSKHLNLKQIRKIIIKDLNVDQKNVI